MKIINKQLLDDVTAAAKENPRWRKNWNIHPGDDSPVRGSLGILVFDDNGAVTEKLRLDAEGENFGADIPSGAFHTAVSLQEGTIFFEAKAGPYCPLTEAENAPWAPQEGVAAEEYLLALQKEFKPCSC
jgi:hypothetical protein